MYDTIKISLNNVTIRFTWDYARSRFPQGLWFWYSHSDTWWNTSVRARPSVTLCSDSTIHGHFTLMRHCVFIARTLCLWLT